MNFNKDILLIDLETTGLDSKKNEIIQIGAILLDKSSLKEIAAYSSFVRPKKWKNRNPESMKINGITHDQVKNAPLLKDCLKELGSLSKKPVILANYGGILDNLFLTEAYKKLGLNYPFDYHTFNIWSLLFPYLAKHNLLTNKKRYSGFSMDDIAKNFKIKIEGTRHDALTDCRVEAEILRKLINKI